MSFMNHAIPWDQIPSLEFRMHSPWWYVNEGTQAFHKEVYIILIEQKLKLEFARDGANENACSTNLLTFGACMTSHEYLLT